MNNLIDKIISPIEEKAFILDGCLAVLHSVSEELGSAPKGNEETGLYINFARRAGTLADMTYLAIDEIERMKELINKAITTAYQGA